MMPTRWTESRQKFAAMTVLAVIILGAGCASAPGKREAMPIRASMEAVQLHETPPPLDGWRGHRLSHCNADLPASPDIEALLAVCAELFGEGSGSDGMIELEMALAQGKRHPLLLVVLGQLYLMGGQGEPALLPSEGPAADTGDWATNKPRLLRRAGDLLSEASEALPDDAAVDYLLADVARAGGRMTEAEALVIRGWDKCTGGRSFEILRGYQQLGRYPAKVVAAGSPVYPADAVARRVTGTVTLDLLLDPAAEVRQVVIVASPDPALARAAEEVFRAGTCEPARIGKYPVWAWLRVSTSFALEADSAKVG